MRLASRRAASFYGDFAGAVISVNGEVPGRSLIHEAKTKCQKILSQIGKIKRNQKG
jgi:hypothetical protein